MRYAVVGTGIVGRTLAGALVTRGHQVVVGTRDPEATSARAEWAAVPTSVELAGFAEAASSAGAVVNATAGTVSLAALESAGADALSGKVVIDVANPLDFSGGFPPTLDPIGTDSLGEQLQRAFPDARVVKTLNTMNCQVMVDPGRVPGEHHVFVGGNDADAKQHVTGLLEELGWPLTSVIDLGDITSARGTEMWLPLWLRLAGTLGTADFNLSLHRP